MEIWLLISDTLHVTYICARGGRRNAGKQAPPLLLSCARKEKSGSIRRRMTTIRREARFSGWERVSVIIDADIVRILKTNRVGRCREKARERERVDQGNKVKGLWLRKLRTVFVFVQQPDVIFFSGTWAGFLPIAHCDGWRKVNYSKIGTVRKSMCHLR